MKNPSVFDTVDLDQNWLSIQSLIYTANSFSLEASKICCLGKS